MTPDQKVRLDGVVEGKPYEGTYAVTNLRADIRAALGEIERQTESLRLAGNVQIAYRKAWDEWEQRAKAAEAKLAAIQKLATPSDYLKERAAVLEAEVERLKRGGLCCVQTYERAIAAEAAHKEAASQWQDEARLRRAAEASVALLDQAATDYRRARDKAEERTERLRKALEGELSPARSDCNDRNCGACSRCRSRAALRSIKDPSPGEPAVTGGTPDGVTGVAPESPVCPRCGYKRENVRAALRGER